MVPPWVEKVSSCNGVRTTISLATKDDLSSGMDSMSPGLAHGDPVLDPDLPPDDGGRRRWQAAHRLLGVGVGTTDRPAHVRNSELAWQLDYRDHR